MMNTELATWREVRTYPGPWGFDLVDAFRQALDHKPASTVQRTSFRVTAIRENGNWRTFEPPFKLLIRKTPSGAIAVDGALESQDGRRFRPAAAIYRVRIENPAYVPLDHELRLPFPPSNLGDPTDRLILTSLRPGPGYPFPAVHDPNGARAIVLFGQTGAAIPASSTVRVKQLPDKHSGAQCVVSEDRKFVLWFRRDELPANRKLRLEVTTPQDVRFAFIFTLDPSKLERQKRVTPGAAVPDPPPAGATVLLNLVQF